MKIINRLKQISIGVTIISLNSTVAVFAQQVSTATDAFGNPVAVNAITSKDQVASNYNGTFPNDGVNLSSTESGINLKSYMGTFTYIENGQAQTYTGNIISFTNPVTGVETLLPGSVSTSNVNSDAGSNYQYSQDNSTNITPYPSTLVAYFEGNSTDQATLESIGKGSEFFLYKNYASDVKISNKQESNFTVISSFVSNAAIKNSANSNMYLYANIASNAVITNDNGSYILAQSNKIDGATIYNQASSKMDIINNYAQNAKVFNGAGSSLFIQGNNVSDAEITNSDSGTITINENVAAGASIINSGMGTFNIARNNANEASLNNIGGGQVFAQYNSMDKATVLIDGKSSSIFIQNTGNGVQLKVNDEGSVLHSYGNSFEGGLIDNNGTLFAGDYVDPNGSSTPVTSKYTNTQINNNHILNISGTLNFENSNFLNSSTGKVNVDGLQMSGGKIDNFGSININSSSVVNNLNNNGIINLASGLDTSNKLTISGNYNSDGGSIVVSTVLGDSNSATDRLHILGDATGSTSVNILNRNGIGALTTGNGINIIKVDGTSSADAFSLKSDYSFEGRSAIIAGAYAYSLFASNAAGNFDGNWYLRSLSTKNGDDTEDKPVKPVYSATAPLYEAYPQILLQLNKVGTLEQRVGNRTWLNASKDAQANTIDQADGRGFWMKVDGGTGRIKSDISKTNSSYDIDLVKTLLGLDFIAQDTALGKFIGGVYFQYGHAKADIDSRYGNGEITTDGYGFGGTLTWYGANGLYVDGVGQVMFYDSDIRSNWLENGFGKRVVDGNRGRGYAVSIEAGKKIALNQEWAMTPQVQLSYNDVDFNSFNDNYGGHVNAKDGNALTGRLGMQFDREVSWKTSEGDLRRLKAYGIGNLYYDFLNGTNIDLTGVNFRNRSDRFWGGLGTGISYNWKDDAFTIYSEIDVRTSFTNFSDSYSFNGTVGFKARF